MYIQDKKGTLESFSRKGKQKTMNEMFKDREFVITNICKCIYGNALPFNLVRSSLFVVMLKFVAKYENGLKPPTYYEVRVSYLKKIQWTISKLVWRNIRLNGRNVGVL